MSAEEGIPLEEVLNNLCTSDPRSPYAKELMESLELIGEEPSRPRDGCYCDYCFYGSDKLAMEILRLRGLLGLPTELPK